MAKQEKLADLMKECVEAKESGKAAYVRADELMKKILPRLKVGKPVKIGKSGRAIVLVDSFDGKDIVWSHTPARRYELREV